MAKSSNSTPRISVNKLAEFTTAKAGRQRQILRDQKFPTDYKGMYYKESSEAIASCIANGLEAFTGIYNTLSILSQSTSSKVGTQRRINANMDALETFESMLDDIDLKGSVPSLGAHLPPKLMCRNVEISVRPEVILRAKGKGKSAIVGATKLYFVRTYTLNDDSAGYISAVLQEWCKAFLPDDGLVSGPLCPVIDVGAKKVWPGVKATTARMKDIEASCQNIFDLWASIKMED
jgi:hypothetical protein